MFNNSIDKQLEQIGLMNRAADQYIKRIDRMTKALGKEIETLHRYNRRMFMLLNGYKINGRQKDGREED